MSTTQLGPVQVAVIAFEDPVGDGFADDIRRELDQVHGRGVVRMLDALFLRKTADGELVPIETEPGESGGRPYGIALRRLAGIEAAMEAMEDAGDDCGACFGLTPTELRAVLDGLEPETGAALVLFEHAWAAGLGVAVREAGGRLVAQGILTRDAVRAAGAELIAISEAEAVMEVADAVRSAALLDALAYTGDGGRSVAAGNGASAVAAESLRTLIVAGLIDDSEAEPALVALLEAGLLDAAVVARALDAADATRQADLVADRARREALAV